jgi:hypothetical protein
VKREVLEQALAALPARFFEGDGTR